MEVLPIKTPVLTEGDDLAGLLAKEVREGDIIVVSSKAVATVEGAAMNLSEYTPSPQAIELSQGHGPLKSPAFYEAVLQETARMNGSVIHANYGVALTELHPDGMEGCFLVPNAGLDMSNIAEGCHWVAEKPCCFCKNFAEGTRGNWNYPERLRIKSASAWGNGICHLLRRH